MSWIEELYRTYDNCYGIDEKLLPPFHMRQNTHIEIIISAEGEFLDAKREELKNTLIPCTEKSESTRTSNPPPHPLCDKIQFVAKDYKGIKRSHFSKYIELLGKWANSEYSHPIVSAVYKYVSKGQVVKNLTDLNIIQENEDPSDLFIRWKVEIPGENETRSWESKSLYKSWQDFYAALDNLSDICMVTGERKPLAFNHPKKIRYSGDGGKLISSNDKSGFTFRGRFFDDEITIGGKKEKIVIQPATISTEVSQKAHRALSWLIERQGFRNGDQVIVAWAVSGRNTPAILADSISIFGNVDGEIEQEIATKHYDDVGQTFARRLSKKIAGYRSELGDTDKIVVLGLDSAGPGRISITYYRELTSSDFLERIENWHNQMVWRYRYYRDKKQNKILWGNFTMAPSPDTIAEACYGTKRDEDFKKFKKSVYERLLPCIIDGNNAPVDLVLTSINKASNRLAYGENEKWQWENALSVACSLYSCNLIRENKNNNKTRKNMALENERNDRDYLYGRLLAVAEHIEEIALNVAKESRETTAARLMQRFADFPFSTWRNIESALVPYKSRLQVNRPAFLYNMKNLLDEIHSKFIPGDFENNSRLSGAYLLGYHCQRFELKTKKTDENKAE